MPTEEKDPHTPFFGTVHCRIARGGDGGPGPFTRLCDGVEANDAARWLRSADSLVEDVLEDGGLTKKARRKFKHLADFIGNAGLALDGLRDDINAIRLEEYRRAYGDLPRTISTISTRTVARGVFRGRRVRGRIDVQGPAGVRAVRHGRLQVRREGDQGDATWANMRPTCLGYS